MPQDVLFDDGDDGEHTSSDHLINNGPYQTFLSRNSGVKKGSVFAHSAVALAFTAISIGTFLYEVFWDVSLSDGQSRGIFPFIFLCIALFFWGLTYVMYRRYLDTFGSMSSSADGGFADIEAPRWEPVSGGVPSGSNSYSNLGELIGTGVITVFTGVFFVLTVYNLKQHHYDQVPIFDGSGVSSLLLLIVSVAVFTFSVVLYAKAFKRYRFYSRFSRSPLETGIFTSSVV